MDREDREVVGVIIDTLQNLNDDQRQRVLIAVAAVLNLTPDKPIKSRRLQLTRNV